MSAEPSPLQPAGPSQSGPGSQAELLHLLREAAAIAEDLAAAAARLFSPEDVKGCAQDTAGAAAGLPTAAEMAALSVDEKLAKGNEAVAQLKALAFQLCPERAMDAAERELPVDMPSKQVLTDFMTDLIAGLQGKASE